MTAAFTDISSASGSTSNLVLDPGFAKGTGAWTAANASMAVVGGYDGHRAIRVTNATSTTRTLALNDKVNTVLSTTRLSRYTLSAYIRSVTPGFSAAVRLGEWKGGTSLQTPQVASSYLRDSSWRRISVSLTARASGDAVDVNMLGWQVPAHQSFDISQPSVIAEAPVPVSPPPTTPAPTTPAPTTPAPTTPAPTTPAPTTSAPTTSAPTTPAPTTSAPTTSAPTTSAPTTPSGAPGYHMVWNDEFNGTAVDPTKWNVRNNFCAGNEYSTMTNRASNVFVSDGALTLRALREQYTACGITRGYTSGYLDTIGKQSWQNGRWEMRAKLSDTKGSWPAFWLRANHTAGEIDILEAIGGLPGFTSQTVLQSTNNDMDKRTTTFNVAGGVDSWHTYGFTKTDTTMSWDIDGHVVYTVLASSVPWLASTFADTMNIRLNQQVGGVMPKWWHSDVDANATFPSDYQIDYIRVFQV